MCIRDRSGTVQFMAGMRNTHHIVAVNTDPEAVSYTHLNIRRCSKTCILGCLLLKNLLCEKEDKEKREASHTALLLSSLL